MKNLQNKNKENERDGKGIGGKNTRNTDKGKKIVNKGEIKVISE
jgi:hypothetical protein